MGRRQEAWELERQWRKERQATALSLKNGRNILRRGLAKLDVNQNTNVFWEDRSHPTTGPVTIDFMGPVP